jgi:hypothetical protein
MHPHVPTAEAPARNPVARSLALAVLGVALVGTAIMGAAVFLVLLSLFAIGYLVSHAHGWWRMFRARRRITGAVQSQPLSMQAGYIEGEYEVVEAAVDAAPRGPGGTA